MSITYRPVRSDDEDFLYALFASTRDEAFQALGLGTEQIRMLLRMQFTAQKQQYDVQFPDARHEIMLLGDTPIGRVMVQRTDQEHRGVDIAFLPEFRDAGHGSAVINDLLSEAANKNKPFRIAVERLNRAKRLYERLGFVTIGDTGSHYEMEWLPEQE